MISPHAGDVPVVALLALWTSDGSPVPNAHLDQLVQLRGGHAQAAGAASVWWKSSAGASAPGAARRLILGDYASLGATEAEGVSGAAARVDLSASPTRSLTAYTSITGLPPLYLAESGALRALTSDVELLRGVPGLPLAFDDEGVVELSRFGHPSGGRTLFRGVRHVDAGARLTVDGQGGTAVERVWRLPAHQPLPLPAFVEAQAAAFAAAVRRLPRGGSFLSMTAGLDTRAVFAALAAANEAIPAATITGPTASIDARVAQALSRGAGVEFIPVVLDDAWDRALPSLVERASVLSGGLDGFGQAPDTYLYDVLGPRFEARCSGNLGNQVGRGGTEGVSVKHIDPQALVGDLATRHERREYWLFEELRHSDRNRIETLVQREVPFTLAANSGVGSRRAMQVTPYADRGLIETLALRPDETAHAAASPLAVRLRDLRHRFFGEPEARSFQRRVVCRAGGIAAQTPINWGWVPTGGVSLTAAARGVLSGMGAAARAGYLRPSWMNRVVQDTGAASLHSFRDNQRWLSGPLRTFVLDTLTQGSTGLPSELDAAGVRSAVHRYFAGEHHLQATVVFALNLTLAHRQFVTMTSPARDA